MEFIKKTFIKNYKNLKDSNVRNSYGIVASSFGLVLNLLLFSAKLLIGILANSITIISDSINSLSDSGSAGISLVGFKVSNKPASKKYPYGFARFEYISGLLVCILITIVGVLLFKSSLDKILKPETVTITLVAFIIMFVAICGKFFLYMLYKSFNKSINSTTLKAMLVDARNDVICSTLVFISMLIMRLSGINIDGYVGIIVSLFIIISSLKVTFETISPLISEKPTKEEINKIKKLKTDYDGILGIHDIMIHHYGQNKTYAVAHAEVDCKRDIMDIIDDIEMIERDFKEEHNIHLTLQINPIQVDNPEVKELKEKTLKVIKEINPNFEINDFRLVKEKYEDIIIFDVIVPFGEKIKRKIILEKMGRAFNTDDKKYEFIIDLDRDFTTTAE